MATRWEKLGLTEDDVVKNMVGWLIDIEQNNDGITATLASYDHNRMQLGGIPAYSFLLAFPNASLQPQQNLKDLSLNPSGAALLLRLVGSTTLRQQLVKETLVQHYQSIPTPHNVLGHETTQQYNSGLDIKTHNFLSFGGYTCQVLGSIFIKNEETLAFGADIEYLPSACIFTVTMPTKDVLTNVIKIIKGSKSSSNENMMKKIGFNIDKNKKESFSVGNLRYSATQNLQQTVVENMPDVQYNFDEIIAQRTAVFGMTRSGKSNMIKNLIAQLHIGAAKKNINLGQLVFDINGEYANINEQDAGSLADAFGQHVVRFAQGASIHHKKDVLEILPDFYNDLQLGLTLIQKIIKENGGASSESFMAFMNMRFSGIHNDDAALAYLRIYLYRTLLFETGYGYNNTKGFENFNFSLFATENKTGLIVSKDPKIATHTLLNLNSFEKMAQFCKGWDVTDLHPEIVSLVNLIRKKTTHTGNYGYIVGHSYIGMANNQHCSNDSTTTLLKSDELLTHIKAGKLVIIDLSGSPPSAQLMLMKELASKIFQDYLSSFTNPDIPVKNPPCLIYVEEAHNLLGKKVSNDDIWIRIAKEGAKTGLGLVYATQEPSAIEGNILSNTENFVVCHLNNTREVKEISQYFDFDVFSNSIIRLQEPGFVRIKQRDMPFVIPVQVHKFDVEAIKKEMNTLEVPNQQKLDPPVEHNEKFLVVKNINEKKHPDNLIQQPEPLQTKLVEPTKNRWNRKTH